LECRLALPFGSEWNGRRYTTKTVRPIFAEEENVIVVVTVYVYWGAPWSLDRFEVFLR
jgi:hypothetical protein